LSQSGKAYRAESYAAEPTPPNSINEKTIVDAPAVGEAIRRAVKRAGTSTKDAAIAIGGDAAITKIIQMPRRFTARELEGQVEIQADQYIPFPMEEVSFDFEVMGPSATDPEMLDILLVATRTENVDQRKAAVEAAGPRGPCGRRRTLCARKRLSAARAPDAGRRHAAPDRNRRFRRQQHHVQCAAEHAGEIHPRLLLRRAAAHRGDHAHLRLSLEDAGRAKKEGGLPGNYQPEVLDPFMDDMTQQVSRSLQFFLASGGGREQPDQILVCGGCANIPGVADVISSKVGIPTEIGDPLGQMKISSRAKSQGIRKDSTALLTACGLALRSFD
jgi:type IV pilus assembly protein PilM